MNAETYAEALEKALINTNEQERNERIARFLSIIKRRGHSGLLPRIVHVLERKHGHQDLRTIATVARERDVHSVDAEVRALAEQLAGSHEVQYVTDDTLIGGYVLRTPNNLADRSYKRALLDVYRKVTI